MAWIETLRADICAIKSVHLYHNYLSNCSQRVSLALCGKGVDHVSHHIDLQSTIKFLTYEFLLKPISLKSACKTKALDLEEEGSNRHSFLKEALGPDDFSKERITQDFACLYQFLDLTGHLGCSWQHTGGYRALRGTFISTFLSKSATHQ